MVYPHYRHHPEILQPLEHTTVRVKVELAEPVPDGMVGTLHLGTSSTSDLIQKSYLAVNEARYGDNFIVAAHPNQNVVTQYEFRENDAQDVVLMYQENTGQWTELPDDPQQGDFRTSILTIMPSVDIDCDSDNTATPTWHDIDRSDWEEQLFELKVTIGAERGLSYWLDQEKTPIIGSAYHPDDWDEFEEAGKMKRVYQWVVCGEAVNYPPLIYVEGINPESLNDTLIWRLFDPDDEEIDVDAVRLEEVNDLQRLDRIWVKAETRLAGTGPEYVYRSVNVMSHLHMQASYSIKVFDSSIQAHADLRDSADWLLVNPPHVIGDNNMAERAFWVYDAMVTGSRFHATLPWAFRSACIRQRI